MGIPISQLIAVWLRFISYFFVNQPEPTMTGPRPFNDTIATLRYGTLHDDLTKALNQLTDDVTRTGKVGAITLSIKLKPTNNSGQIEVIDDIKVTTPKETKGTTIMFATPENNLQREDPRQLSISGLRTVDMETGELRKVG